MALINSLCVEEGFISVWIKSRNGKFETKAYYKKYGKPAIWELQNQKEYYHSFDSNDAEKK